MRGALVTVLSLTALIAALLVFPNASTAALQVSGDGCTALPAGQHIDAGTVCVSIDGETLLVTYNTTGGWELTETHLYVDDVHVSTTAPGQYGNLLEALNGAAFDSYSVSISSDPIYIVAHAVVCGVFPESEPE